VTVRYARSFLIFVIRLAKYQYYNFRRAI